MYKLVKSTCYKLFSSACSKKLAEWQETQGDVPRIISQKGAILSGGGGRSPQQKIQTQPNIQSSTTTITASLNANTINKERDTATQQNARPLTEKKLSPVISEATNGMSKVRRKTKYPINIRSVSLILPL